MADKKISALTGATTPLAGTEVLPIVQSGVTVKVAVSDLTAGRSVDTGTLTPSGNVRVGFTTDANWTGTQVVLFGKTGASNPTYPYICSTNSQELQSGSNAYWDGTNWKYQFAAGIAATRQIQNYNGFYWDIGDGGTAGTTVTWKRILVADTSYNVTVSLGNAIINTSGKGFTLPGGITWTSGSGSPEGVVTAPVGSLYSRSDGGVLTSLYVKQSGTGNTGWIGK